jgi:CRP-like cAMP-binding protein
MTTISERTKMNKNVSNHELALRSRQVLDLGPRQARLIFLAGVAGIVLVVVASLTGNQPQTIGVDKLLHFGGYATLAAIFVLSLPPRWYLPALLMLAGSGLLIELLQPLNLRTFDLADGLANTLGVATGAAAGLGTRLIYGYLKTELAELRVRHQLLSFAPGEIIVREGQWIDQFYIIKTGTVALYRRENGSAVLVTRAHAGEMFGLLEEILHEPLLTTVVAETAVTLYRTDYDRLIADVGGRSQPLGIVLNDLAVDLREAWKSLAALEQASDEAAPPKMKKDLAKIKYGRSESPRKAKANVNQSVGPARVLATSERIPAN